MEFVKLCRTFYPELRSFPATSRRRRLLLLRRTKEIPAAHARACVPGTVRPSTRAASLTDAPASASRCKCSSDVRSQGLLLLGARGLYRGTAYKVNMPSRSFPFPEVFFSEITHVAVLARGPYGPLRCSGRSPRRQEGIACGRILTHLGMRDSQCKATQEG
jgi:hypothetical protein